MYETEKIKSAVATNISSLRVAKGLTQLQLAEMLSYSDKAVSKWERGESVPDIYVLKQIADLFEVTVDYLITLERDNDKPMDNTAKMRHKKVTAISLLGVISFSCLLFVLLWILIAPIWQIFVYTIPALMILMIVFNSMWGNGRRNFWWISGLIAGIILSVYVSLLSFAGINLWQILLLVIPAEFVLISVFKKG